MAVVQAGRFPTVDRAGRPVSHALLYFRVVHQDGGVTLCLLSLAGVSDTVAGRASNAMGVRPGTVQGHGCWCQLRVSGSVSRPKRHTGTLVRQCGSAAVRQCGSAAVRQWYSGA
jgi:hypothetical protein